MTKHALSLCLACGAYAAAAPLPLLYLPFDGDARPTLAAPGTARMRIGDGLSFRSGIRGQAAHIVADVRAPSKSNFSTNAGTFAFWLKPAWSGSARQSRYLFCVYGHPTLKEPWMRNRWSLSAGSGRLHFWVVGENSSNRVDLEADIGDWEPGGWRHVAATWSGINSGGADAAFRLFVDGKLAAEKSGLLMSVGRVADWMDIGRDSDMSPDYADADYDEFYIYGEALSREQIARAVALGRAPAQTPLPAPPRPVRLPHWADAARPFRCRVTAPAAGATDHVTARLPLDFQRDLNALGTHVVVERNSLMLTPAGSAEPMPFTLEGDALLWSTPGDKAAAYDIYFSAAQLDLSTPLFARRHRRAWTEPTAVDLPARDYAADAYGDAWDFEEGDFEAIDQWGNRPWCLRNRKVENGVLSMDVSEDPWFIWGNMWGQIDQARRPVAIDLRKYPILKMRVRQSCPEAQWEVFGRGESTRLRTHKFTVRGQGWQIVRIDLTREARWSGVLRAFRIDPTADIKEAHVEIDWVRLTCESPAARAAVEALPPPGARVAKLSLHPERKQSQVGSQQRVVAIALDPAGKPVAGLPVTFRLRSQSGGRLERAENERSLAVDEVTRRGLTNAEGRVAVMVSHGRRPGQHEESLFAAADFLPVQAERVAFDLKRGPAHRYRVAPVRAVCRPVSRFPLQVDIHLVDALDNPIPAAGRVVQLSAPPGATLSPARVTTDARGHGATTLTVDSTKRWVYWVEARDSRGLSGRSGNIALALTAPRPSPVRLLPNGYFAFADGTPFVPLGGFYANWVHGNTPDGEWRKRISFTDTTDEEKRRWMRFLTDNGVTAMRLMLRTHRPDGMEPMDIIGRVNLPLFSEALRYLDLAREFGLMFQLVVHEDYTKPAYFNMKHMRLYALPQYADQDLDALPSFQRRFVGDLRLIDDIDEKYTDPDVIACQDQYARELAGYLRGNPQVFAYELENEMVACPASWANHATEVLRAADPQTLVCVSHGGGGLQTGDPLWWRRFVHTDFYNYHLYPHGTTSEQMDYGAAVDVLTRYGRMAGQCLFGESVGDQFERMESAQRRAWVVRDIIWLALANGNPGVFFWNALGSEVREFRLAKDAMSQLDLTTFRRAQPEIGVEVSHPLNDDQYYRTPQGRSDLEMMGRYSQHYLGLGVDFDFTVQPQRYRLRATLREFSPPSPTRRYFTFGDGWQLASLARSDWREALVYVRNFAGIETWDVNMRGSRPWRQFLRQRQPARLRLKLHLPQGAYSARVYDLDERSISTRNLLGDGVLDLGRSDHDFAIVFKRPP